MKRLLLFLLAAALPANADDLESKRAEAAKLIGRAWELRGKSDDEAKDVAAKATAALKDLYPRLAEPSAIVLHFPGPTSPDGLKLTMDALKRRLNAWGAKDARVLSHDGNSVLVLLNTEDEAGLGTEERETLGWTGPIEFRLEAPEDARKEWKGGPVLPAGTHAFRVEGGGETFLANEEVLLDSRSVESAAAGEAEGRTEISLTLSEDGGKTMEKISAANNGRRLAIIFGDAVLSAPTIRSTIGRQVTITGTFTRAQANRIVAALKAGALPCRLEADSANSARPSKVAPLTAEPAATFIDRLMKNNLIHAILEDLLRERDDTSYKEILEALKPIGELRR